MSLFVMLIAAVGGLAIGPFVYALAIRAGRRQPLSPALACEACGAAGRSLSGPCEHCGTAIRRREPIWWIVTGIACGAAGAVAGPSWTLPAHVLFAILTVVLTITDLDHKLIPNAVLYPGGTTALVLLCAGAFADGDGGRLPRAAVAGAGYFAILFLVAVVARGGFGFGDVKLAALLGPFVAYQSLDLFLLSVFFTGAYGGLAALFLIVSRRAAMGDELPYGPAMILGAWTALIGGSSFLEWMR